jgi:hypothetical protein
MRVPIENGLGLINQVLDFIKPSAVTGTELCKRTFYLKTIFPVIRYSSSANT